MEGLLNDVLNSRVILNNTAEFNPSYYCSIFIFSCFPVHGFLSIAGNIILFQWSRTPQVASKDTGNDD